MNPAVGNSVGLAANDIHNGGDACSLFPSLGHGFKRVDGFARLANGDGQSARFDNRVAVTVLGAVIDFYGDAGKLLE